MNALVRLPYEFAWRAVNAIAPLLPASSNKVVRTVRSRANLLQKIDIWAGAHRDSARPLLWMHAASVGESLQALPVLKLFRERHPDAQIVFSFYSPSAEATASKFPADFVTYLPFDSAPTMRHVIESLKPSLLVFSKLDVWPTLVEEARRSGVRTAIISGTVHSDSGRRSTLAGLLLSDSYASIDSVGAVSPEDRDNIIELGVRPDRVTLTGDTRFDQVWERRERGGPAELLDHLRNNRPTIVAGSTWKSDEVHLLKTFSDLTKVHRRLRLIIAPHEPNAHNVSALNAWAASNSLSSALLDDPKAATTDVVIVHRMGVLGDLYALADIAYVGGGFQRAGLHSVLEPAAFGKPVVFGQRFGRTRDADLLAANYAGIGVRNAGELAAALSNWLTDSSARLSAGLAAESVVKKGLGAAEASYTLMSGLMAKGRSNAS